MPNQKPMSLAEQKALFAELRADEHAARSRDYGEADAATSAERVKEGSKTIRHLEPEPAPITKSEIERAVSEVEQSWAKSQDKFKAIMQGEGPVAEPPSDEPEKGHTR
jgi:hypothetical protein